MSATADKMIDWMRLEGFRRGGGEGEARKERQIEGHSVKRKDQRTAFPYVQAPMRIDENFPLTSINAELSRLLY